MSDTNYKIRLLFPCSFHEYYFTKEDFNQKELIDFCYKQKEKDTQGMSEMSNNGGWHSQIFSINEKNPITKLLKKGLYKSVLSTVKKQFIFHIEYWIMIINTDAYHNSHFHPNSNCSGVVWIKIPQGSDDTRFSNPYLFHGFKEIDAYHEEFKQVTNTYHSYDYHPQEGLMVTFPSYVFHEVRPNKTNEDRIAVSYNISFLEQRS